MNAIIGMMDSVVMIGVITLLSVLLSSLYQTRSMGNSSHNYEKESPIIIEANKNWVNIRLTKEIPLNKLEQLVAAVGDTEYGQTLKEFYSQKLEERKQELVSTITYKIKRLNSLKLDELSVSRLEILMRGL